MSKFVLSNAAADLIRKDVLVSDVKKYFITIIIILGHGRSESLK